MPTVNHIGVSRKIDSDEERQRLKRIVMDERDVPGHGGFIVRTVAENEPSEKLTADIKFLLGLWNEVGKKRESMRAPACVHPDLDLILRSIRDLFSDEVEKLVIDDRSEFERVRAFVEQAAPELRERIELYSGEEPIFDEFGIEQELIRAQNRKVWLKSGGYIIIDQTEALVAIDVNSGRYVGKKGAGASLEDTITKINCEAAKEIVYQLRLRNIGGQRAGVLDVRLAHRTAAAADQVDVVGGMAQSHQLAPIRRPHRCKIDSGIKSEARWPAAGQVHQPDVGVTRIGIHLKKRQAFAIGRQG